MLSLNGGSVDSGGGTLTIGGNVASFANATTASISGNLNLGGATRTFDVADGGAATDLLVGANVSNGGLIKEGAGTLALTASGGLGIPVTLNTGTLVYNFIQSGGSLTQNGGTIGGALTNQGTFTYNGGTFSGQLVNQGSAIFNATFTAGNGLVNFVTLSVGASATLTLNGTGLNNQGTCSLAGGTLTGNGPLVNNSSFSGYGTIAGSGGFINNALWTVSGGNLNLDNTGVNANNGNLDLAPGLQLRLNGGPLNNAGSITLNNGSISGSAMLNNISGGTIIGRGAITCPFNNNGGIVYVDTGTLNISQSFSNSGLMLLDGVSAGFTGGLMNNSGSLEGLGNVGNAIANDGIIEPLGGQLTLTGAVTNNAAGLITAATGNRVLATAGVSANAGVIFLTGGTFDNNNKPLNNTGQLSGYGTFRSGGLANNGSMMLVGDFSTVNGNVTNAVGKQITVAYDPAIFTGTVVNNGTFKSTSTTVHFTGTYIENGVFNSDPATNNFNSLIIGTAGYFLGGDGDVFSVSGNFQNGSLQNTAWNTGEAEFVFRGAPAHTLHLAGADAGTNYGGFTTNFAWKTFRLAVGESLTLQDGNGTGGGALYTRRLILEGGLPQISSITGNGFKIYYDPTAGGNAYLAGGAYALAGGGAIVPVTLPPIQILSIALTSSNANLDCSGVPNAAHSVQASTNLINWATIGSANANGSGSFTFADTNAPTFPRRFYRLSVP